METHSSQQVARTIKNQFKLNNIQLTSFARDNGVTPTQIYSILSGKEYIPAPWALKFNSLLGISIFYAITGNLPAIDPEHKYDVLLEAATSFKDAVDLEDRIRDEYERMESELDDSGKAKFKKALLDARLSRMKLGAELTPILKEGWNEDGEEEPAVMKATISASTMKLHEAIGQAIREAGHPLTYTEIANAVNEGHLYLRKDGTPVPASQISARVKNYPQLFRVNNESGVSRIDIINK